MTFTFNKHFYKTPGFWLNIGLIVLILWPVLKGEAIHATVSNWLILGVGVLGTLNSLRKTKDEKLKK